MVTLLLTGALMVFPVESQDTNISKFAKPEKELYVKTQYAGNMGFISVGVGSYFFNDKISADINYGLLSKYINGVRVHSFSIKPAYNFKEYLFHSFTTRFYTGVNVVYSIGRNIYSRAPNHYPRNYYPENAFHFNPFIGLKQCMDINARKISKLSLFAEFGTVDYEIWYALKNKEIAIYEIVNLCFGVIFQLK
jgi:hypothetical protein